MLSQLSYFPTWTPQRGVARYVCHSSAAVKSFLYTGRPSVRREGPDIRGVQEPVSYESGSGKQDDIPAPVTARVGRSSCPPLAPVGSRAFSPWYAGRRAPAFPERLRESKAAPNQAGIATPCPPGYRGIPGPCLSAGNLHATPDKARDIPGSSPSVHPLKKIGRAAPVGLGYREKKRYRSPLVSL